MNEVFKEAFLKVATVRYSAGGDGEDALAVQDASAETRAPATAATPCAVPPPITDLAAVQQRQAI